MSSFFTDALKLGQKGYTHARAEVIGILNPNRRHDEPEEQAQDALRQQIRDGHRHTSFAPDREGNTVKWHIDGHDYMWALSEMLDEAKEAIFILDWWLSPELYLRRPPAKFPEWRLDRVLQRKAEQGVKVHVIVYKEVTQTMSMSSKHTKNTLEKLHPNITCMRHPDHIGAKDSVQFWSHHEKVVVVDNHFAAIGGLDLCFGRWDTHTHPLADVHPTDFSLTLFPGQDYNNARIADFKDVYNYANNGLSILESARMPWHDVHMTFTGRSVLDVSQHFIERWNEIKKRKYRDAANVAWLALPHDDAEPVIRHPHREQWKNIGYKYAQRWHLTPQQEEQEERQASRGVRQHPRPHGSCNVQVVRSVSDWSHGVLTEDSIQRAYIDLITRAEHFVYIENQFFISATKEGGVVKNLIAKALVDRIVRAAHEGKHFKVIITIPEVPGFAGDVKSVGAIKTIMAGQYRTINRGGSSIYEEIRKAGYEPLDYIRFYHLRSYDRINAPLETFIKGMEQNSGVRFVEAQVALARQWVDGDPLTSQKEVQLILPQETSEAIVVSDKNAANGPKTETVPLPASNEEARRIIERFEHGASSLRGDEKVSDNVAQHMLSDKTGLLDEIWLGTEQEELNSYVSELLYIHTKLMVVDDRIVIMGSANINDRSQKGDGDSEIALIVEDRDMIDSYMDGQEYKAGRFAATLRRKLFREHLGLIPPQIVSDDQDRVTNNMRPAPIPNDDEFGRDEDNVVQDPLSVSMQNLWNETARKNREIFTEIFRPVPTNLVRSWPAYEPYVPKVKPGHVRPGAELARVKSQLSLVRGALVECPLDFLIDDKEFVEAPEWKVVGLNPTLPIYI
ncbi:phospholipase D [Pluteus cervinus]|uniref:Phospholipase D n=1 Tax=Pluteus cervinus TaxID=181527 RepID=A0ACD3B1Y3_9AGAR|nr:phospholipase D [Pluteus cervinus]